VELKFPLRLVTIRANGKENTTIVNLIILDSTSRRRGRRRGRRGRR
jgi:hypothetical protein